jgi:TP901 family phage tail tape measure protein
MSDSQQIGSLHYDIDAPNDKLEKSLDDSDKKVRAFADKLHDGLNKAAAGFAVVGAGLTLISKNATDFTVQTVKNAKTLGTQIGVTTQEASRLMEAFKRMGISAENASQMFGIFSKNISKSTEDIKNGGSKAADAFDKIKVSVVNANGTQKDFSSILFEVADRFKAMPNGIEKTSTAMELFGRSGKEMIKVLNLGSDGIKELEKKADELGLTLTEKNIGKVNDYVKSQKDLKQSTDDLKIAIGTTTAPVLAEFNKALDDIIQNLIKSDGPMKDIVVNIAAFGGPIAIAAGGLFAFAANLVQVWPALATLVGFLGSAALAIGGFLLANAGIILIVGAIAVAAFLIITHFDEIKKAVIDAVVKIAFWFAELPNRVESAFNAVISWFKRLPGMIINAVGDAGSWLYNAGKDIIGGLIRGIKDQISSAVDTIKNVGKSIISAARVVLDWHSPSKVFVEAGKSISEGMAIGIHRSAGAALGAMNSLSRSIISPNVALSGGAAPTSGDSTTYGGTVVNIGQVNDKSDADYIIRRLDRNFERVSMGISPA